MTRRLLDERAELVKQGQTPRFTDIRHFFYECRNVFLRENPSLTEIDSKSKMPYADWQIGALNKWSIHQCESFGIPKELYWRVREKLNVWAEAKAVCEGESGKFLVDRETRERTAKDCSFILLCEKKTVSRELLERLKAEGYKVNLVSTGGYSPSDVQEAVLQISEELDLENPTFYFLVLHDFDLDGVKIYFNLRERYAGVIDVGVNSELIKRLIEQGSFDLRLTEEQKLNKNHQGDLRTKIEQGDSAYTLKDFEYLQGQLQSNGKEWIGKRIEIDAIHVQYGIGPFVKYILEKIEEECSCWDLSRIGLGEFELEEPSNPYQDALDRLNQDISETHDKAWTKICEPLLSVDKFVENITAQFGLDIQRLRAAYGIKMIDGSKYEDSNMQVYELDSDEIANLKTKYIDGFAKQYAPNYSDELDELNAKVTHYEGDVTKGIADLQDEHSDLQGDVDSDAENDEDAQEFESELDEIEWGQDKYEKLAVPDEREVIRIVINKLTERLATLNNGHNNADSEGKGENNE